MRIERWLGLWVMVAAVAATTLPGNAQAQGWLEDRQRTEGPGFRIGDFELHPGLGVEIGYDSNLYYADDDATRPAVDSGILRATAHLMFATRGQQRRQEGESSGGGEGTTAGQPSVTFRGGVAGSFYTFFNDIDRSNMELDASLALNILPGRPFSVSLTEQFGRSIRPFAENFAPVSYARIQNDAGVAFNFNTTGQVLQISAGYNFRLDFFEDELFQYGNRFQHVISLKETFRFLPQTALIHDTSFIVLDYFGPAGGSSLVNDGFLLRSRIGLNGAFTREFSVLATVGYAAGFYSGTATYEQEYESVAAQVEARWQISEQSRLTFGYDRDFQPSFVGNFYRRDRGYAAFQTVVDGSFLLGLDASFGYYEFGAIVEPDGMTPVGSSVQRGDYRLIGSVFGEYRFTNWLGLNATLRYTGSFTDYEYEVDDPSPGTPPSFLDPAGFNKFEAWLGVRVFY